MTSKTRNAPKKTAASAPRATATIVSIPVVLVIGPVLLIETEELIFLMSLIMQFI